MWAQTTVERDVHEWAQILAVGSGPVWTQTLAARKVHVLTQTLVAFTTHVLAQTLAARVVHVWPQTLAARARHLWAHTLAARAVHCRLRHLLHVGYMSGPGTCCTCGACEGPDVNIMSFTAPKVAFPDLFSLFIVTIPTCSKIQLN